MGRISYFVFFRRLPSIRHQTTLLSSTQCSSNRSLLHNGVRRYSTNAFYGKAPRTAISVHSEQLSQRSAVTGRFVSYPENELMQFMSPFLKRKLVEQLKAFNDYSLLLRRHYLDILQDIMHLRSVQQDVEQRTGNDPMNCTTNSVPRFILYGQPGTGISTIMAQLAHYATLNDWLIFPFCEAEQWLERCPDLVHSNDYHQEQHKPNLVGDAFDFPSRSADWLRIFVSYNKTFLEKHRPVITRDVAWTRVDVAPAGTPWMELIDFSTTRTKYSTDCIGILLREMRSLCSKRCGPPCLLLVDGVNFLWCRGTLLRDKTLQIRVTPDRLAIVHHLKRALQGDWHHGIIVSSLNVRGAWPTDREKYTPGYLLGKTGFEFMDPFVPVLVENYSAAEMDACFRFYAENHWLTNAAAYTETGRAEMTFLSDRNPLELDKIVAEW